jgi:hypothetical protein
LIALHQLAGRFIHHQQMIVFIQHQFRQWFHC